MMESLQCSPRSNASQGITANPDISGIGVRTAIYIQAALSLVHAYVAGYDGKIDDSELESLFTVFTGILLPGCALLLSAIIQAKTFGLSAYHAMIVLFLSWINNTTALTFFVYIVGECFLEERKRLEGLRDITKLDREWAEVDGLGRSYVLKKVEETLDELSQDKNASKSASLKGVLQKLESHEWTFTRDKTIMTMLPHQEDRPGFRRRWAEEWEENARYLRNILPNREQRNSLFDIITRKPILWMAALTSTHLTLLSTFGWWFWSTLPNFGINQECIPSIRFVFFTKSIPITSEVLRFRSKSIYIFSSLPGINIYIWVAIVLLAAPVVFDAVLLAIAAVLLAITIAVGAVGIVIAIVVYLFLMVLEYSIGPSIERASTRGSIEQASTRRSIEQASTKDKYIPDTIKRATSKFTLIKLALTSKFTWSLAFPIFFVFTIFTTLAIQTVLISITELTIAHNQHLIQSKEGDWTFGQTLALMLTLMPLVETVKFLWGKRPRLLRKNGKGKEKGEKGA